MLRMERGFWKINKGRWGRWRTIQGGAARLRLIFERTKGHGGCLVVGNSSAQASCTLYMPAFIVDGKQLGGTGDGVGGLDEQRDITFPRFPAF